MSLSPDEVARLAELARLGLDQHQLGAASSDLNSILAIIDVLQGASLDAHTPLAHPLELTAALRDDLAQPTPPASTWLDQAPQAAGDLFLVPRFVE